MENCVHFHCGLLLHFIALQKHQRTAHNVIQFGEVPLFWRPLCALIWYAWPGSFERWPRDVRENRNGKRKITTHSRTLSIISSSAEAVCLQPKKKRCCCCFCHANAFIQSEKKKEKERKKKREFCYFCWPLSLASQRSSPALRMTANYCNFYSLTLTIFPSGVADSFTARKFAQVAGRHAAAAAAAPAALEPRRPLQPSAALRVAKGCGRLARIAMKLEGMAERLHRHVRAPTSLASARIDTEIAPLARWPKVTEAAAAPN